MGWTYYSPYACDCLFPLTIILYHISVILSRGNFYFFSKSFWEPTFRPRFPSWQYKYSKSIWESQYFFLYLVRNNRVNFLTIGGPVRTRVSNICSMKRDPRNKNEGFSPLYGTSTAMYFRFAYSNRLRTLVHIYIPQRWDPCGGGTLSARLIRSV